jgi:hypothetical protein
VSVFPGQAHCTANATASKTSSPDSNNTAASPTRYEKLHASFAAMLSLACILLWLQS